MRNSYSSPSSYFCSSFSGQNLSTDFIATASYLSSSIYTLKQLNTFRAVYHRNYTRCDIKYQDDLSSVAQWRPLVQHDSRRVAGFITADRYCTAPRWYRQIKPTEKYSIAAATRLIENAGAALKNAKPFQISERRERGRCGRRAIVNKRPKDQKLLNRGVVSENTKTPYDWWGIVEWR